MTAAAPEPREVIHVQAHAEGQADGLEEGLLATGWHLRTWNCADIPLPVSEPRVGLFDLRGLDRLALQGLCHRQVVMDAFAAKHVVWVAVVHPEQLGFDAVRRLVHDYCHDYVTLPCDAERLGSVLGHAFGMAVLSLEGREEAATVSPIAGMVGQSEGMRRLADRLCKAATSEAPVFLSGETGTGKELAAAAIHRQSARSAMPFVGINCGAIPHSLMQSELFGYERGAFTGAVQRKLGRVELAHHGTLFLDEIADLPMESQASLLRFLEQGTIERLGGQSAIEVDARIVSATHVDLAQAVAEGRFRADLYHRLRVIELQLPPLRERGADITLIARDALHKHAREGRFHFKGFSPCALRALQRYDWPGNVRELVNRVREAMVMADGCHITARDLRLDEIAANGALTLDLARRDGERMAIERALDRNAGRLGLAARELGVSRVTLYRLMLRHGLQDGPPVEERHALALIKGGRAGA